MKKRLASVPKTNRAPVYERIRQILDSARSSVARSVNTTQVVANWLVGREIVEEEQKGTKRADYGKRLLESLAERLREDYGPGYSLRGLQFIRQFYVEYPSLISMEGIPYAVRTEFTSPRIVNALRTESAAFRKSHTTEIRHTLRDKSDATPRKSASKEAESAIWYAPRSESWQPGLLSPNLSWTHYRTLLRVGNTAARAFYEIEALKNNWSGRELERQINSLLYERLARSRDKSGLMRLATRGQEIAKPADIFKDPVVIEFLGLPESPRLVETRLEEALINNLRAFLLELGIGFAFVARQKRITLDGDHFYIDLVFYHTILKCFVAIDLKVGKLTHQDLGQLQLYVNYFDREISSADDNPTLGLILCTDKNDAVVKYTLGPEQEKKIFASRYKLYLPTEAELQDEIRRELKILEATETVGGKHVPAPARSRKRTTNRTPRSS
jgi:predicted nuclease of restriction endonuclease-like (RecB) superfamily